MHKWLRTLWDRAQISRMVKSKILAAAESPHNAKSQVKL